VSVIIVVVGSVVGSVSLPDVEFVLDLYTKSVALLILKCLCFMVFFLMKLMAKNSRMK
jgi:hypothetical protein